MSAPPPQPQPLPGQPQALPGQPQEQKPMTLEQVLLQTLKSPEQTVPALIEIVNNKIMQLDAGLQEELSAIRDRLGTLEAKISKLDPVTKN